MWGVEESGTRLDTTPRAEDFRRLRLVEEWAWDCQAGGVTCLHVTSEGTARRWAAEQGGIALRRAVGPWVSDGPEPEEGS
jgi:hypothetical protein